MSKTPLVQTLQCKRCRWSWYPRAENPPKVCPKCKRVDWNEEKRRG